MKKVFIGKNWPGGVSSGLTLLCSVCRKKPKFDYTIKDDTWLKVVPYKSRLGVVCLPCFDRLATKKGIDISEHLVCVQFTGIKKTIILEPSKVFYY